MQPAGEGELPEESVGVSGCLPAGGLWQQLRSVKDSGLQAGALSVSGYPSGRSACCMARLMVTASETHQKVRQGVRIGGPGFNDVLAPL